jgi:hypothetical protein
MLSEKMQRVGAALLATTILAGCATPPSRIKASYVSPMQYGAYTCDEIGAELVRVNREVLDVTKSQQKEADKDAVAMSVGLIIFWPALFLLAGDDQKAELSRLKGEYEALEASAEQKECDLTDRMLEVRKDREGYQAEREALAQAMDDDGEDLYPGD